uniref:Inositol polyphosphate-related phosphatase domain-containing protein n=1 Tax=Leersia perrieri TaxID=77586 RepID=A0A0D9W020_9ORYZ
MREESNKKSKLSWSKSLVRKWFNIKNKANDFNADYDASQGRNGHGGEWRTSCSEREAGTAKKSRTGMVDRLSKKNADCIRRGRTEPDVSRLTEVQDYRIFASTWNVGGKSPSKGLDLDEWLHSSPPADIYVLGFQEIVPLNAGNVLGTEDNLPAKKWVSLIRRTLNRNPGAISYGGYHTPSPVPDPVVELDADFEGSSRRHDNLSFFHRRSFQNLSRSLRVEGNHMVSQPRLDRRFSVCDPVSLGGRPSDFDGNFPCVGSPDDEYIEYGAYFSPFPYGYGASIPMEEINEQPNSSRYCLVASKQMVGIFLTIWVRSELRDDVKNLKVSCVGRGLMGYLGNKGSISISMSLHHTTFCFICCHLTSGEKEGDELRRNSDVMEILRKTRFPRVRGAGDVKSPETILEHECDRILWHGNGLIQLSYVRGESRFSDHRPVYSIFMAEVEIVRQRRRMGYFSSRVEVEELLPYSYSFGDTKFY